LKLEGVVTPIVYECLYAVILVCSAMLGIVHARRCTKLQKVDPLFVLAQTLSPCPRGHTI